MDKTTHPYFVENGESRRETAILLVGTADEFGIPQRDIAAVRGGFRISDAMAKVLYDEPGTPEDEQPEDEQPEDEQPEDEQPEDEQTETKAPAKRSRSKKTSGNRAAKNTATEQE